MMSFDDVVKWMNLRDAVVPDMPEVDVVKWRARAFGNADEDFCVSGAAGNCDGCPLRVIRVMHDERRTTRSCWIPAVLDCLLPRGRYELDPAQAKEFCTCVIEFMAEGGQ